MSRLNRIPIKNIYYLLCYAWNELEQGELLDLDKLPSTELVDLFAFVLCEGLNHLVKRGLEQDYVRRIDEISGVRGRIDLLVTVSHFLPQHGRAACTFDELSVNTLPNQIIKTTLSHLLSTENLDKELRAKVNAKHRDLHGINEIVLSPALFQRVQLRANNRFYRFLLNVCELINGSWLVEEQTGIYRFREFRDDERAMASVFERFLFNFINLEVQEWKGKARKELIKWNASALESSDLQLIPMMVTDISLKSDKQYVIIDAKYYRDAVQSRYGSEKFRSGHLYQLLSYLANAKSDSGRKVQGMLIYPQVNRRLRERFEILGFDVRVNTVDLNNDWQVLKSEIIEMFQPAAV